MLAFLWLSALFLSRPQPARAEFRINICRSHQKQVDQSEAVVRVREQRRPATREKVEELVVNDGQLASIGQSHGERDERTGFVKLAEDGTIHDENDSTSKAAVTSAPWLRLESPN